MMRNKSEVFFLAAYCTVAAAAVGFIILFSLFSFYRYPILLPQGFTLDYWRHGVLENRILREALQTSCVLGILNGVFSSLIGLVTARGLAKSTWVNQQVVTVLYSIPLLIPAMALFIGVHQIMIRTGLINTWAGVVIAHSLVTIPYSITLFLSFFKGISPNLEIVARSLGAGNRLIFFRVLLPLIKPVVYMVFGISFLISFSEYFSTALIGGGRVITLSSIMYPLISNGDINNGSVISLVFLIVNGAVLLVADHIARKSIGSRKYLYE